MKRITQFYKDLRQLSEHCDTVPVPTSINQAYSIQHTNYRHFGAIGGWKLGGTNEATQKLFGVTELYYGPIFEDEIHRYESKNEFKVEQHHIIGEVEVAFKLSSACTNIKDDCTDNIARYVDAVCIGIELPWTKLDVACLGVKALIADMCGSGGAVCGPMHALSDLNSVSVSIRAENIILMEGNTNNLIAEPLTLLANFLALAKAHQLKLNASQLVFTGGMTPCVPLPRGKQISMHSSIDKHPFEFILN